MMMMMMIFQILLWKLLLIYELQNVREKDQDSWNCETNIRGPLVDDFCNLVIDDKIGLIFNYFLFRDD